MAIPFHRRIRSVGDGVCEVPLTHGKLALIDEQDVDLVGVCTWFAHIRNKNPAWYATGIPPMIGKQIRLHRYILGLMPGDKRQGDHINGNVADNRRCNLRIVTNQQNNMNRQTPRGKAGLKGVTVSKNSITASITIHGKQVFLGRFPTAIEAALAYDAAAIEHFGEFAATNASLGLLEAGK